MKTGRILAAGLLLLALQPVAALAGWGFSYHQSYAPPPVYHCEPPCYGPYGGVVHHYYPAPRPYFAPHHHHHHWHGPPRAAFWFGF